MGDRREILKDMIEAVLKKSGKVPNQPTYNDTSTDENYNQQPTSSTDACNKYQHLFDSLDNKDCAQCLQLYFKTLEFDKQYISDESKEKIRSLIFRIQCDKLPITKFLDDLNGLVGPIYQIRVDTFKPFFIRALPLYRQRYPIAAQCKTLKNFDETLKKISDHQDALIISNKHLAKKIRSLEEGSQYFGSHTEEEALVLTFGLDESSLALRQFIDHYQMAKEANIKNKVSGWNDSTFRAYKLCFQLRNEAASWVFKEMCSRKGLAHNDDEIIAILCEKYLDDISIEEKIIKFEQLEQEDGESLSTYMQRCQNHGELAFSGFGENSMHQRVVWKFISGIKDLDVRSAVMASKWMQHQSEAKPTLEILKCAELETEKMAFNHMNEIECSSNNLNEGNNLGGSKKRSLSPTVIMIDSPKIPKTELATED